LFLRLDIFQFLSQLVNSVEIEHIGSPTHSELQGENVLTRRRKFSRDHRVLDPIVLLESEPAEAVEGH
jgi:hypothetical protein